MTDPKAGRRYVYFMRPVGGDGRIKIGCSYVPARRLEALSVHCAYQNEIIGVAAGGFDDERMLHEYFAADRLHREWFRSSPELLTVIQSMGHGVSAAEALADLGRRSAA